MHATRIQAGMPESMRVRLSLPRAAAFAACLTDDGLEHAACAAKILQVTGFGAPGYLVQPADRGGFETGFRRAILGVNNLDFHFHGILTALNPTLPGFTSLFHSLLKKWTVTNIARRLSGSQAQMTSTSVPSTSS